MNLRALLIGCLLSLLTIGAPAQDCERCGDSGLVPCNRKLHRPIAREVTLTFCSESASCSDCQGALAKLCPSCDGETAPPDALIEYRQLLARLKHERERRLELFDGVPGRKEIVVCETPWIRVAVSAPQGFKIGGRSADSHDLAHWCVAHVAAQRGRFLSLFGLREWNFPRERHQTVTEGEEPDPAIGSPRIELYLLADEKALRVLAPRVTGIHADGLGVMKLGKRVAACLHFDASLLREEPLRRHLAHVTAHLLFSNTHPSRSLGELGHGWIEAGVAHYFEDLETGSGCTVMCFGEQVLRPTGTYRGGDWRRAVLELVAAHKERTVRELFAIQQEQLDPEAHAQSFAFVDFLISQDDEGGQLLIRLKQALVDIEDPVAAVEELYPSAQQSLDERFRDWVLSNYAD